MGPTSLEVLKDIDLNIDRGDLISIMGQSGSGKSTLMNIIGMLDRPTSGSYSVDGIDVLACDKRHQAMLRNRFIGFVFQAFHLLPRLTAEANVALPLLYRGVSGKERRRIAHHWLDRVGMADRAHHRPNQLSGGQRQRVAIARALVGSPHIVLADEPTGALDARTSEDIMSLLLELNSGDHVTIIIITHDAEVAAQCIRRLRLASGALHETARS